MPPGSRKWSRAAEPPSLTPQVRTIHRHADTVVVNFDPDAAPARTRPRGDSVAAGRRAACSRSGARWRARSRRVRETERRGSVSGEARPGRRLFSLAGGPGANAVRHAVFRGKMAAFKFLLPAVQKISDKLEQAAIANDLASDTWAWIQDWCWISSRSPRPSRRAPVPQAAPASEIPAHGADSYQCAAFERPRARSKCFPSCYPELTDTFVTGEIFEGLRQAAGSGGEFSYSALEGRLEGGGDGSYCVTPPQPMNL